MTLIRHACGVPPSPKGKASTWSVFTLCITANTLILKGFARNEKHKPLAFPAGEGADQRSDGRRMRVTPQPHFPSDNSPLNSNLIPPSSKKVPRICEEPFTFSINQSLSARLPSPLPILHVAFYMLHVPFTSTVTTSQGLKSLGAKGTVLATPREITRRSSWRPEVYFGKRPWSGA